MDSVSVKSCYISCSCNRTPHCADWDRQGLIAYGTCNGIAIYKPQKPTGLLSILVGHKGRVNCVKWIPPSNADPSHEIVSASTDKTAIVWSITEEKAVSVLSGHTAPVTVVTALTLGNHDTSRTIVVTASTDSTVRVWERQGQAGEFINKQVIGLGSGFALDLSLIMIPNTTVPMLAWGGDDQKIHLCLEQNNQFVEVHRLIGHEDWIRGLDACVDDSGDVLLASSSQDYYIRVWRVTQQGGSAVRKTDVEGDLKIEEETFSLNHNAEDKTYAVTLESVLQGHENWIYSVKWQPRLLQAGSPHQPMRLLSASMDKTLVIWSPDPDTGVWNDQVRVGEVGGYNVGFYGGLFSPDGTAILAHGYQGAFNIWHYQEETNTWEPGVTAGGHFDSVNDISWDPEGAFLVSVSVDQTTRLHSLWKADDKDEVAWHEISRPQVHGYDMHCLCPVTRFSFASGADEKVIRVFEAPLQFLENLSALAKLNLSELSRGKTGLAEGASVPALGLSNKAVFQDEVEMKGREVDPSWSSSHNQYPDVYFSPVHMKRPPTEENLLQNTLWPETQKLYGHGYEIFTLACNPAGTVLASASKASKTDHAAIILWNTSSWQQICRLPAHSLTVTQLVFSPSGEFLLSVSRDRTWSLFKQEDQSSTYAQAAFSDKKTAVHARIIWGCAWSHDSSYFITVSRDKKAVVWGLREDAGDTGGCLGNYRCINAPLELSDSITAVDMAPCLVQGRYLVALGVESGDIYLYGWTPNEAMSWTQYTHLTHRSAHHLTVKRLKFRPHPGILGSSQEVKDSKDLQLASCGADHSVRIHNIQFAA